MSMAIPTSYSLINAGVNGQWKNRCDLGHQTCVIKTFEQSKKHYRHKNAIFSEYSRFNKKTSEDDCSRGALAVITLYIIPVDQLVSAVTGPPGLSSSDSAYPGYKGQTRNKTSRSSRRISPC